MLNHSASRHRPESDRKCVIKGTFFGFVSLKSELETLPEFRVMDGLLYSPERPCLRDFGFIMKRLASHAMAVDFFVHCWDTGLFVTIKPCGENVGESASHDVPI